MEIKKELFGFIIDHDVQFDISNKRLVRISAAHSERTIIFGAALLNDAMARLLTCLLVHTLNGLIVIPKELIFREVWEDHGLNASSQQLWRVIRDLKQKVRIVGLADSFIGSVNGTSYALNSKDIVPLFYN